MPIIWVAGEIVELTGEAAAINASQQVAGLLLSAGWVISGAVAYWFGSDQPSPPYGTELDWCAADGSGGGGGAFD